MAALAAALFLAPSADAGWPMARHDPARTGAAKGKSDIAAPVPYFKTYLGGTVGALGMIPYDVNTDGKVDVVYVTGGRVVAKEPNDDVVWQTPPLDVGSIVGIDDLDGDGKPEIVVAARDKALVLRGADGSVAWAEADGEMGTLGVVKLGDVDGDGRPDVIVQECGCCGVNSGKTGFAYGFGAGMVATKLWTMPFVACGGSRALTLVDADAAGAKEVLIGAYQTLTLLDGPTGATLATTPSLGTWTSVSSCRGADLDGVAGEEIVCIVNSSDLPAVNQRRAFALKYDAAAKTLTQMWTRTLAPDAGGDLAWGDPLLDLDGDGVLEIVIAGKNAASMWTTHIMDALTGVDLATIPEHLLGVAPIGAGGASLLLTDTATGDLHASSFQRTASPPVTALWSLPDRTVIQAPDWSRVRSSNLFMRTLALDLNGDTIPDLMTNKVSAGAELAVFSATGATPVKVASHVFPADVDPIMTWSVPPLTAPYPQIAMAQNDGYLLVFNKAMMPMNSAPGRPGLRVGGYYASGAWRDLQRSPVLASLDGGAAEAIVVRDSRGALLRFDASQATLAAPPPRVWQKTHAFAPTIANGLDGAMPGIACLGLAEPVTTPPTYVVMALHADGAEIWKQPIETAPFNDLVPAKIDADGVPDFIVQWGDPGDVMLRTRAISGATGMTLWNAPAITPGSGRQPAGVAVTDWNGDGTDDVIQQGGATLVNSGVNGAQIASGGSSDSYFLPIVVDTNGDNTTEVLLQGGFSPTRLLTHALAPIWTSTDDDRPYPYGAIAACPTGPVLVEGSWANPARIKLTRLSGAGAGTFVTRVLAGGKQYADEATAKADGSRLGQLTAATVHEDLSGLGRASALVGSSDGWLYALDPCTGTLDFVVGFDAAVGEPVFGDTDGDGRDEIIVSVADGFLYGLKQNILSPPSSVIDTDPDNGITSMDVDDIVTTNKLCCGWSSVPSTTKYELAIVQVGAGYVTSPPWTDQGTSLSACLSGLPLVDTAKYACVVRAIDADGHASVDTSSDAVTVHFPGASSSSSGGGMGGAGGASSSSSGSMTSSSSSSSGDMTGGAGGKSTGSSGNMGGSGGFDPDAEGGCGCRVAGEGESHAASLTLSALALLVWSRRRSARRAS